MLKKYLTLSLIAFTAACATPPSDPENSAFVDESKPARAATVTSIDPNATPAVFAPQAAKRQISFDYSTWDDMLDAMVFNMGPSTRQRAPSVRPELGTRFTYGHDSAFRLEGNRIYYSALPDDFILAVSEYKNDLVAIANQYDITTLPRNEQLAFWLNLSNVLTIEQIGLKYPVKFPVRAKYGPDNVTLDEAKLINIRGVALSLKDIRTKIVYANWKSPIVIYGFFRGEIGGPTIRGRAFTADNVNNYLTRNAIEYVNSLRGVSQSGNTLLVSGIYEEARPYYFKNWPQDLRNHLADHLKADVRATINLNAPIRYQAYERRIADLAGGELTRSIASGQVIDGIFGGDTRNSLTSRTSPQVANLIQQ